jgi:DNA mismatch repair protein MutS
MPFHSILFATPEDDVTPAPVDAPGFFGDLNLDQVVEAVTFYKRDYHLKPFFYMPLKSINAITYRHEVMQDLENEPLFDAIERFARHMHFMREHLTQVDALDYRYQKDSWFLDAVALYCDAVSVLAHDLTALSLTSRGLLAFREYLSSYAQSSQFTSLVSATKQLKTDLAAVKYCLLITDNSIQVRKYDAEIDYSVEVEETFSKFKQGAAQDYRVEFSAGPIMNHVEAGILDLVARLYPNVFSRLDTFCAENRDYLDETISVFDREIQFYVAYLEFIARLERAGLPLCYPTLCQQEKEIYDIQGFDLMLAYKLLTTTNAPIVCSDFSLTGEERILVVTGPNQGGKTTFARAFGQIHYLASLGCPVPGREAHLFLFDRLFTHFEKEENIRQLQGKLQDDLVRIRRILEQATPDSIIILNEIFASTTYQDAVFLGRKIMEEVARLDLLCVCVTFIIELTTCEKVVSVVSMTAPDDPAQRTYKLVRRPADGHAYAVSIAEKYHLTYAHVKERIRS